MIAKPLKTPTAALPVSRTEWIWLSAAMLAGAVLRLGNLSHVAVEHFDEAVYAANLLYTSEEGGEYPLRQFYAPPLLPAVIEWSTIFGQMVFGDVPSWWPMLPGLIAGLATIPSVWWIARTWFSPRTGIIAAWLIACHEYHGAYSRTALTDVPLSLFLLWAVYWFWSGLKSGRWEEAVIAGVCTTLAWWTKYNGWLPLAVAASGGVFWQLISAPAERNWSRLVRVWLTGTVTAFVLWLPVLWDCRKVGGYSKVAENHRGYTQGFGHWGQNLIRGYESFDEFVGWLTLLGLAVAVIVKYLPRNHQVAQTEDVPRPSDRLLAECLLGAWFWGLFVATPLYYPYSRLWTPWLVASSLLLAAALTTLPWDSLRTLTGIYRSSLRTAGLCCGLMIACSALGGRQPFALSASLERRDCMLDVARQVRKLVANDDAMIIVGDSDPALWFNLRSLGTAAFVASNFEFVDGRLVRPGYLVMGPLSQMLPGIQQNFASRRERFEFIDEFPIQPSRVSLLDFYSPRDLAEHPDGRTLTVQVYRVKK